MYNHEPINYDCPFCTLVAGKDTELSKHSDIVYQDENSFAWVSPKWWVHNPGHIIVATKQHVENIYDISDELLGKVYATARKMAIALKATYHCDGTSTRQHNEPAGGQDVWHFHIHVFPRYTDDALYQNHDKKQFVPPEDREPFVKKLKTYFSSV